MIPLCIPKMSGKEWQYVKECFDTNWVSSVGKYVDLFEEKFSNYIDAKNAVVTMNGTSSLELALRTLGIGEGDEVIVSSMTFISPVNTIRYVGAEPVFVDICRDTWVMDPNKIEEMITPKTKAIIPVHIYGHPVDMSEVMRIAQKYNLFVIEDATEALSSEYKGRKVGTIGDIGCFSFNGNKLITTGAGGMLVTNNEKWGKRAKYLSTQAKTTLENGIFYHEEVGYNFRMPNILAAMGVAQLESIDEYSDAKRKHAMLYNKLLEDISGISTAVEKKHVKNCFWLYSILVEDDYGISRDKVMEKLKEEGVESRAFFQPVHLMPPYYNCRHGDMSVTEEVALKGINLPSSVELTNDQISKICKVIKG